MHGGYPPGPQGPNPYGQPPSPYGTYGAPPPPPMPGMPGMGPMAGAPYGVDPVTGLPFSDKSKIIAGILQLTLGGFGAGRFYTGHMGIAIAQIAVTWLTCGIGVLWPFIDGIMMLTGKVTDSDGRPLRENA